MNSDFSMEQRDLVIVPDAILTESGTLLPDYFVHIKLGMIADIANAGNLRTDMPDIPVIRLPGSVLAPGFVNAHTHLELGYARAKIPSPHRFSDWVLQLMALYPPEAEANTTVQEHTRRGAAESLESGVTAIGDITRCAVITRTALQDMPIRLISYGEITALGRSRTHLPERLMTAADRGPASSRLQTGLSPHAPYSVEGPALRQIVEFARAGRYPLAMHLAELQEESDFLATLSGPLGREWKLMQKLDLIDDKIPLTNAGPVAWAKLWGLLTEQMPTSSVVLAHCNYLTDADIRIISEARASVAYCPRTHHYFGHGAHGPHPWRRLMAAGVNVCLATDSLASNPDLNVLKEAQWLYQRHPDVAPELLIGMITTAGAAALGMTDQIGRLRPGYCADMQAFCPPPTARRSATAFSHWLLTEAPRPHRVWVQGQTAFSDGREF